MLDPQDAIRTSLQRLIIGMMAGGNMQSCLSTVGLVFSALGVIILFKYAMPFRLPTGGIEALALEQEDENARIKESSYRLYANVGLILVLLGTALQIVSSWISN